MATILVIDDSSFQRHRVMDMLTGVREQCMALGARDFLTKPPDAEELLQSIHNIL